MRVTLPRVKFVSWFAQMYAPSVEPAAAGPRVWPAGMSGIGASHAAHTPNALQDPNPYDLDQSWLFLSGWSALLTSLLNTSKMLRSGVSETRVRKSQT